MIKCPMCNAEVKKKEHEHDDGWSLGCTKCPWFLVHEGDVKKDEQSSDDRELPEE